MMALLMKANIHKALLQMKYWEMIIKWVAKDVMRLMCLQTFVIEHTSTKHHKDHY